MLSRFLQELRLLVGPDFRLKRYLLAVSGGADSTVMGSLFQDAGLTFAVAHCNFHLRGEDSNRDMHFVENLATQWRAPILIRDFDTLTIQQNSGKSVEMVARDLRYSWFRELSTDFDFIVVAHNCTDNAETQLLNLCRGTGLKGLCGIPPVNGKIIRPLLAFTSREIRQYAEKQGIAHVEDYTNMDESISRNRIRHSVLPQLECINPQFLATTERNRHLLQRQYAYYQKYIKTEKNRIVSENGEKHYINRQFLETCEDRELVLYEILNEYGFSSDISEKLAATTQFQSGKQFYSDSHILLIDRDFFIIQPATESDNKTVIIDSLDELSHYFYVEEFEYQQDMVFEKNPDTLYIPKEKLNFPLQIRPWQHGDYFYPLGGRGRQKLSDYFTDHKIDRFSKEKIQLLCSGDNILWIIGLRSDERWKVCKTSTECYQIKRKAVTYE
ncbi:MAG: tRNA lysidine(34) synthetase TilS [Bacteroidales bacterium]|nr:tRNA lysidine(34) synthetase TilS [Bacteroidales bacterium]